MNVRGLIITIASIFGLSLLAAIILYFVDNRQLSERELAGMRTANWGYPWEAIWPNSGPTQCKVEIAENGFFVVLHPAGRATGRVQIKTPGKDGEYNRTRNRTFTLRFETANSLTIAEWRSRGWRQVRDKWLLDAWNKARSGPAVPADIGFGLKGIPSAEQALAHLKKIYPEAVKDPFGKDWIFDVGSQGRWISGADGQPEIY
jgi:hypothetical protein